MGLKWWQKNKWLIFAGLIYVIVLGILSVILARFKLKTEFEQNVLATEQLKSKLTLSENKLTLTETNLASTTAQINDYLNQDQYKINQELTAEIKAIESTFNQASNTYESLLDLKTKLTSTGKLDEQFALILKLLSERKFTTASAQIKDLTAKIKTEEAKIAASFVIPENIPSSNTPPGSGYRRQQVQTNSGNYMVSLVSADLNTAKVIVDTAASSDCRDNCPVLPLADYVSRSGAFAGINGPYFCPATYPACADKKNSFDTLLMNKNKVYFNSENNVYSTVPAVIFSGNSARFVGKSLEWGRSTDPDSVIASQPFLVSNGNVVFGGDGDPKKGSKGIRGFIGVSGSSVYIGMVHNATVAEAAIAIQALGIQNAINLDGGGSAALWSGGYKVGPGRALPFGILLVHK